MMRLYIFIRDAVIQNVFLAVLFRLKALFLLLPRGLKLLSAVVLVVAKVPLEVSGGLLRAGEAGLSTYEAGTRQHGQGRQQPEILRPVCTTSKVAHAISAQR